MSMSCARCCSPTPPKLDQNNDDPMLDYGAAVAIKFASSKNAVRGMTPTEYGTFLRNDPDQMLLLENASCAPAERAKVGDWIAGSGGCRGETRRLQFVGDCLREEAPVRHLILGGGLGFR